MTATVPFVLVGAIGAGKTTLFNALHGNTEIARKTQAVEFGQDGSIDTPGEFFSHPRLYHALINTSADAEKMVYVHAADDPECRLPTGLLDVYANRPLIGVISKVDMPEVDVPAIREMLRQNGVTQIFEVSAESGTGIDALAKELGLAH